MAPPGGRRPCLSQKAWGWCVEWQETRDTEKGAANSTAKLRALQGSSTPPASDWARSLGYGKVGGVELL